MTKDHLFKPGQSGNPNGRPRGTGAAARIRSDIAEHVPGIIAKLAEQALDGDTTAARLLLERACPAIRPVDPADALELQGQTLTEQGRSALAALANGEIATSQFAQILTALASLAKLVETDELERRIAALEGEHDAD